MLLNKIGGVLELKKLIRLANKMDSNGLHKEADTIDDVIKKLAAREEDGFIYLNGEDSKSALTAIGGGPENYNIFTRPNVTVKWTSVTDTAKVKEIIKKFIDDGINEAILKKLYLVESNYNISDEDRVKSSLWKRNIVAVIEKAGDSYFSVTYDTNILSHDKNIPILKTEYILDRLNKGNDTIKTFDFILNKETSEELDNPKDFIESIFATGQWSIDPSITMEFVAYCKNVLGISLKTEQQWSGKNYIGAKIVGPTEVGSGRRVVTKTTSNVPPEGFTIKIPEDSRYLYKLEGNNAGYQAWDKSTGKLVQNGKVFTEGLQKVLAAAGKGDVSVDVARPEVPTEPPPPPAEPPPAEPQPPAEAPPGSYTVLEKRDFGDGRFVGILDLDPKDTMKYQDLKKRFKLGLSTSGANGPFGIARKGSLTDQEKNYLVEVRRRLTSQVKLTRRGGSRRGLFRGRR